MAEQRRMKLQVRTKSTPPQKLCHVMENSTYSGFDRTTRDHVGLGYQSAYQPLPCNKSDMPWGRDGDWAQPHYCDVNIYQRPRAASTVGTASVNPGQKGFKSCSRCLPARSRSRSCTHSVGSRPPSNLIVQRSTNATNLPTPLDYSKTIHKNRSSPCFTEAQNPISPIKNTKTCPHSRALDLTCLTTSH